MEISTIFGLPAHPLIVHAPVVLIPLTALLAVVMVAWKRLTRPLSLVVGALALVNFGATVLATGSGEALEERVPDANEAMVHRHAELGETLRLLAFIMLIVVAAYLVRLWAPRLRIRPDSGLGRALAGRAVGGVLAALVLVMAVLTTTWVVRTGHTGAEAVWKGQNLAAPAGGGDDEGLRALPRRDQPAAGSALRSSG